jgi:hypothetical protein
VRVSQFFKFFVFQFTLRFVTRVGFALILVVFIDFGCTTDSLSGITFSSSTLFFALTFSLVCSSFTPSTAKLGSDRGLVIFSFLKILSLIFAKTTLLLLH